MMLVNLLVTLTRSVADSSQGGPNTITGLIISCSAYLVIIHIVLAGSHSVSTVSRFSFVPFKMLVEELISMRASLTAASTTVPLATSCD